MFDHRGPLLHGNPLGAIPRKKPRANGEHGDPVASGPQAVRLEAEHKIQGLTPALGPTLSGPALTKPR